jgi:hypothetical protein
MVIPQGATGGSGAQRETRLVMQPAVAGCITLPRRGGTGRRLSEHRAVVGDELPERTAGRPSSDGMPSLSHSQSPLAIRPPTMAFISANSRGTPARIMTSLCSSEVISR